MHQGYSRGQLYWRTYFLQCTLLSLGLKITIRLSKTKLDVMWRTFVWRILEHNTDVLPWLEISTIKFLCGQLDTQLRERPNPPETTSQLQTALLEDGTAPHRLQYKKSRMYYKVIFRAVIAARGGHIPYQSSVLHSEAFIFMEPLHIIKIE